jgi:hypothetical protein
VSGIFIERKIMGLTIHYSFKTEGDEGHERARELVQALHQTAQDLPFKELGEVVELEGKQCDPGRRTKEDPLRWLLIQATESVEVKPKGKMQNQDYTTYYDVMPSRLIAFTAWPGEGCEESNFGLCQYPNIINTDRGPLKTGLSGWHWSSFVKDQYASNPQCGGVPNFLRCHLTVIAMLDRAKQLGCLEEVSDEGGFWQKRDLPALVKEIGSWNEMIAALGGKLKDFTGNGPVALEAAIAQFPNFEQLEAAGQSKLPPELQKLFELMQRVGVTPSNGLVLH